MTISIYQNPFVFEKHGPHFSDYVGICIKHHKDEKSTNTEFHHILPEHKGGTNDRWNKVHLEYELHVEAHRLLMEAFPEDEGMKMSYIGTKNRGSMRGEGNPMYGMTGELHPSFGQEPWNKNQKNVYSPESLLLMSENRKGITSPKMLCPYCNNEFRPNTYARWHGPKCKKRL
jgi:hypothetical protein